MNWIIGIVLLLFVTGLACFFYLLFQRPEKADEIMEKILKIFPIHKPILAIEEKLAQKKAREEKDYRYLMENEVPSYITVGQLRMLINAYQRLSIRNETGTEFGELLLGPDDNRLLSNEYNRYEVVKIIAPDVAKSRPSIIHVYIHKPS